MTMLDMLSVTRLTRDQRAAAATLGPSEARFLVDTYYQLQHERITAAHRSRHATEAGEPNGLLEYLDTQFDTLEGQIKGALLKYADASPQGQWAMSQKGIGPVIAAGLIARLDLRPTVGAWWRFAGLDPTQTWGKGEKRPHNAALKRLCWLLGESFVKVSGYEDAFYGRLWRQRKEWETARNEAGEYAERAAQALAAKKFGAETDARKHYEIGRLPPGHIHARSKRWAVKLFLAHLHHVWHEVETGSPPPKPYVLEHLGHAHAITPPGWPLK